MEFTLEKSQKEIVKAAREFARGEFDKEMILERSVRQEFPKDICKKAADLGFIGIHFPEAYEGGGMGLFEHALVFEEFCKKDSTLGMAILFSAYAAECICRFGETGLKEKWLLPIINGQACSTGAFYEPGRGTDLSEMVTTAGSDGEEWFINGSKAYVPNGGNADLYVVLCQTDPDVRPPGNAMTMILVEADCPGISSSPVGMQLGGNLVPFSNVTFDNVRVPKTNTIGKPGSGHAQLHQFLNENRIQIAALAIGTAQGAFDRALDYVKQREQFGKKLARFQITRHKLAEMSARLDAARVLVYFAAWHFDKNKCDSKTAATAKLMACRTAMEVADEAIQLLGGYGYMTEYEIEHFYRDAKMLEIFQGPPIAVKDVIADHVIGKIK